jgi:hypothetical protein
VGGADGKYTPGPGFYNSIKNNSTFNQEFMRSHEDQDLYYVVRNGTLMRKTQAYAATKAIS